MHNKKLSRKLEEQQRIHIYFSYLFFNDGLQFMRLRSEINSILIFNCAILPDLYYYKKEIVRERFFFIFLVTYVGARKAELSKMQENKIVVENRSEFFCTNLFYITVFLRTITLICYLNCSRFKLLQLCG